MSTAFPSAEASASSSAYPSSSISGSIKSSHGDEALLTYDVLDEKHAIRAVSSDGAGATVLFSGTTRDSFRGKSVSKLEYEAYTSLALKTLQTLLEQAHTSAPFATTPLPRQPMRTRTPLQARQGDTVLHSASPGRSQGGRMQHFDSGQLATSERGLRRGGMVVGRGQESVAVWKREFYASGDTITALDGQGEPLDSIPGEITAKAQREGADWAGRPTFQRCDSTDQRHR